MSIFVLGQVVPPREVIMPFGCGALLALLAGSFLFFRWRARRLDMADEARRSKRYAADLTAEQVDEWRLRVVNAVEVEEFEDEGMQFYLEFEDGRVLFLMSQDFAEARYEGRFPSREVIITRLPHTGEMLNIEPAGDYLPVSQTWSYFSRDDYESDRVPEHGTLLPGPLSRYRPEPEPESD